ncbi:MAG: metalloregulator ArsR/SmtB family transcription factor [Alphaproteobacteria bacterium]
MNDDDAVATFGALAHPGRLAVFRLLLAAWPGSLPAGAIGERLGVQPSTLSAHLAHLERVGLVTGERVGRQVPYLAVASGFGELLRYLTTDCCGGRPEFCHPQIIRPLQLTERSMSDSKVYNVLFLCTGNSARSVMAECLLNREGQGRFRAFSAGSHPAGQINPNTEALLARYNFKTDELRSKSWDEFATPESPAMDFVFTVCDSAAAEVCPVWPGQPMSAHWGFPDPAAFEGSAAETAAVFADVFKQISTRISIFVNLPLNALDKLALQKRLDEIGETTSTDNAA